MQATIQLWRNIIERDAEIAHAVATGLGDHAKIARLDAAIAKSHPLTTR